MNKLLPTALKALWIAVLLYVMPVGHAFAAPSLQFDKTAVTVTQNATFELKVQINVDNNQALGSDAIVKYAGSDLEVISITTGGFFPEFGSANDPTGRVELHGYTSSTNDSRTGNGTLAKIVFKGKKSTGSSTIVFGCNANGSESNILTIQGQNILACTQTNQAAISYTGTTSTNTPTATPTGNGTPSPTNAPNTVPTCTSAYTDISSVVGTPIEITLTCSGKDPDGYINAAEFTFGDGSKQTVEKNAGSPGSITTKHTYTTIGSLGVSCRVRDNNNVWSSTPDVCKKIVTIKAKPTPTPTPIRSNSGSNTGSTTIKPTSSQIYTGPTPTPTPIVVAIISEIPDQEPIVIPDQELYPTESPDETGSTQTDRTWWVIGGIIALFLAYLLLRRKGPPKNPTGQVPISTV